MAKGAQDARPLSPHLQIWGWTVTMAASIIHRATGVALYAGAGLLALWLFAAASGPELFGLVSGLLASPIGLIILFGFSWAALFHALNGIRHFFWDAGRGFALAIAQRTAWLVFLSSFILAGGVAWAGLHLRGIL